MADNGFIISAAVEVGFLPSWCPTFSILYLFFPLRNLTLYGPKYLIFSFRRGPNWVRWIATESTIWYIIGGFLRLLQSSLLCCLCRRMIFLAISRNLFYYAMLLWYVLLLRVVLYDCNPYYYFNSNQELKKGEIENFFNLRNIFVSFAVIS